MANVDLETFKKRLKDNHYASLGGARKAIAKAGAMSRDDREKAEKAAKRKFKG